MQRSEGTRERRKQRSWRLKSSSALVLCVSAIAISLQACSGREGLRRTDPSVPSSSSDQTLPFHADSARVSDSADHPSLPLDPKPASTAPFQTAAHSRTLPAGTLITVRLESPLILSRTRPGDTFVASIAGPVSLEGETVLSRGLKVTGHVEATEPGVLRLTLDRLSMDRLALDRPAVDHLAQDGNGQDRDTLRLQTSSLFAKAISSKNSRGPEQSSLAAASNTNADSRLPKGHRLTFRLVAPLTLSLSTSPAS